MIRTLISFASRDGLFSLWSGISASILRQSTYSTARFGLYQYFAQEAKTRSGTSKLSLRGEVTCAAMSGGLAGLIGNPTEVALVRMCADGAKSANQRFGYNNCFDALLRIGREEGLRTFTRGVGPNVVRSVLMNIGQIATYSAAKTRLLDDPRVELGDGMPLHVIASLIAGTVATTICAPADVLKSRVQNSVTTGGVRPSVVTIMKDAFKQEGPMFLMRGWTPAWLRLAPNTILTFVFMEQLKKLVMASSVKENAQPIRATGLVSQKL